MSALLTVRDTARKIIPRWLREGNAQKLIYAYAVQFDALVDASVAAVKLRFPGLLPDSGQLALIGADRKLRSAPGETSAMFAARLRQWRQAHQRRGNPYALLEQLRAYFTPFAFDEVVQSDAGPRYTLHADGSESWDFNAWNWDGVTHNYRYWVILYPPSALITDEGLTGDDGSIFGEAGTMGSTASVDTVAAVEQLVLDWSSAHGFCSQIIVVLDATAWAAAQPNGTWQFWANRNPAAVYWVSPMPERA